MLARLQVQIERYVDEHFPGFVACVLIDADGVRHELLEKAPVVSAIDMNRESVYPQPGYIGCVIENEWLDQLGRRLVRVNTEKPWSIESVTGARIFTVLKEQISRG